MVRGRLGVQVHRVPAPAAWPLALGLEGLTVPCSGSSSRGGEAICWGRPLATTLSALLPCWPPGGAPEPLGWTQALWAEPHCNRPQGPSQGWHSALLLGGAGQAL